MRKEIVVIYTAAEGVLLGILTEFFRLKKKGPLTHRKVDKRQDVLQFTQNNLKITQYLLSHYQSDSDAPPPTWRHGTAEQVLS